IRDHPLSYYAMLAYGRLASLDADRARALARSLRPDISAPLPIEPPAGLLDDDAFRRGRALMQMGLREWGEGELDRVQVAPGDQQNLRWLRAELLQEVGAFTHSHRAAAALLDIENVTLHPTLANLARWDLAYPRPFS